MDPKIYPSPGDVFALGRRIKVTVTAVGPGIVTYYETWNNHPYPKSTCTLKEFWETVKS